MGLVLREQEGRFVFVHVWIDSLPLVILGLYIPPPATLSILHQAASFAAKFPGAILFCVGDFNLLLNPSLDKFHAPL